MAGFKGQAEYSVDSKGRVAIPAKMRKALNPEAKSTFTITRGFEECIFLYPQDRWTKIEDELSRRNLYNRRTRNFVRRIMRWAAEVELDGQGRIVLPKPLIAFGSIDERATILGNFDHIEIWNPDVFEHYCQEQTADYEALAEEVMG